MIGGVAVLLMPIPFIFYKYGEPIRKRSKFAPTPDKKDEHEESDEKRDEEEGGGGDARARSDSTSSISSTDVGSGNELDREPKHLDKPETQSERMEGDQALDREIHSKEFSGT